jgi:hypothetical protein
MKEIQTQMMRQWSWIKSNQVKGVFVTGFAANSVSEAAQILIKLSIQTEKNK